MFNKEFYPTPISVLDSMQIDCINKIVLEPSAGKGDIVDYLYQNGATDVLAIEINEDLRKILSTKCNIIGNDFFNCKAEHISHINLIVMNPPFSNADEHILHAFEIAPEGCEIIALCNYETIENTYSLKRRKLKGLIKSNGTSQNLGNCFSTAERTTGIDIGLIKIYKAVVSDETKFEGFFMDEEEELQQNGIMQYNEIRALVNRYVGAVKIYDRLDEIKKELAYTTKEIGLSEITFNVGYNEQIITKEDFSKHLQKTSWKYIFNKMNMQKYVTSGVMKDINKFVETQQNIPFTMKNVYKMFEIIVGTREQTYNRALEEAIDNFTRYTHENRYSVEGWKSNSSYMLNKKFIVNCMVESNWGRTRMSLKYSQHSDKIDDLIKVLCNITGTNYNDIEKLRDFFNNIEVQTNVWYECGFFVFKCFLKGTMHFKFKDENTWYLLNHAYGKLKGFTLAEKYKK
jgi:predicted rRNA methylase YqxC with S4 and FtsJ domains